MAFPFKSLRYVSGPDQIWGIQFRRSMRYKNEWTYWTPVPQNMPGPQGRGDEGSSRGSMNFRLEPP